MVISRDIKLVEYMLSEKYGWHQVACALQAVLDARHEAYVNRKGA
jgi:hypothetical protein